MRWMALEWFFFFLETWIKEDTLVEKKEWQRGWTRTQYIHPSIYSQCLSYRVMGRLEPFLGHRQENTLEGWPVHPRDDKHTNIHIHTHSQSVVHLSCTSLDCERNPEETNVNSERTNTKKGLLVQLGHQYIF